jgi:acyl phosphate:glycerol-3-phosphate acyltransferase
MSWIQQIFGQPVPLGQLASIFLGSYILGCIATGYYLVRLRLGQDVREMGSGNIGAKNVGRVLGRRGFWITMLGDFAKGALAVWIIHHFIGENWLSAFAMLAVVTGHIWPIQLGFRGGKGIATSVGAMAVYDYHLALAFVGLFAAIYVILRKTALSGLIAFAFLPLVAMFMAHEPIRVVLISILAGIVLVAHRRNLIEEITSLFARRDVEDAEPKPDQSFE